MRKVLLFPILFSLLSSVVLADYGMMDGYGMMGGGIGMGLIGIIYLAMGAFVFSVIFWLTHNWLVKDRKRR